MARTTVNFWLDVVSLLVMVGLAATGGVLYFVLPPGTGHSHALFGLGRHDYGSIHALLALAAVVLLALHLALHWTWVCCVVARWLRRPQPSPSVRAVWGLVVLMGFVVVTAGGLAAVSGLVVQRPRPVVRRARDRVVAAARPEGAVESAGDRGEAARGAERARPPRRGGGDHRAHARDEWCPAGQAISGRVTLGEAAGLASVSVEQLCDHLGIPRGIDRRERLGRLRRYYGFEVHDIRRLACRDD